MPEGVTETTTTEKPLRWRRLFVRGLVVLLPTIVTIILLVAAYDFVDRNLVGPINRLFNYVLDRSTDFNVVFAPAAYENAWLRTLVITPFYWLVTYGLGLFVAVAVIYLAGLVVGTWLGRRVWGGIESRIIRFPLVRTIYPSIKQVTGLVFSRTSFQFRAVVAFEYPRAGVWSIGFVTSPGVAQLSKHTGRKMVTVFLPSSPAAMTGWVVFVDEAELLPLDLPVGDALRLMLSGGLVTSVAPSDADAPPHPPLAPA